LRGKKDRLSHIPTLLRIIINRNWPALRP